MRFIIEFLLMQDLIHIISLLFLNTSIVYSMADWIAALGTQRN